MSWHLVLNDLAVSYWSLFLLWDFDPVSLWSWVYQNPWGVELQLGCGLSLWGYREKALLLEEVQNRRMAGVWLGGVLVFWGLGSPCYARYWSGICGLPCDPSCVRTPGKSSCNWDVSWVGRESRTEFLIVHSCKLEGPILIFFILYVFIPYNYFYTSCLR